MGFVGKPFRGDDSDEELAHVTFASGVPDKKLDMFYVLAQRRLRKGGPEPARDAIRRLGKAAVGWAKFIKR